MSLACSFISIFTTASQNPWGMIGEVKGVCVLLEHQAHWGAALWGPATGLLSAQLGVRSGAALRNEQKKMHHGTRVWGF